MKVTSILSSNEVPSFLLFFLLKGRQAGRQALFILISKTCFHTPGAAAIPPPPQGGAVAVASPASSSAATTTVLPVYSSHTTTKAKLSHQRHYFSSSRAAATSCHTHPFLFRYWFSTFTGMPAFHSTLFLHHGRPGGSLGSRLEIS